MANTLEYIIKLSGTNKFTKSLGKMQGSLTKLGGAMARVEETAFRFANVGDAFQQASEQLNSLVQPGVAFETLLKDLQAITGLTGQKLEQIGQAARQNAKIFGGEASQSVESYKLLLSQLGPSIADSPKALEAMGKNVSILSKTMGGDAVAATEVLTAAMNQYGVSLDNPMAASQKMGEFMNTMAAAAKEGSAELPMIQQALQNVGAVAKDAGVSFSETNAAIQLLDKYGKRGAEGGVALRNVLATLGRGRFLPQEVQDQLRGAGVDMATLTDKTLSLSQRLQALQPVQEDSALLSKLFGKENQLAGLALIQNAGAVDELNGKIQGTNTATEQAEIVMGSYAEKMNRLRARFKDLGISIFNATKQYLPLVQFTSQFLMIGSRLTPLLHAMGSAIGFLGGKFLALGKWLFTASLQMLRFGARLLLTASYMTGRFLLSIGRGIVGLFTFSKSTRASSFSLLGFLKKLVVTSAQMTGRFVKAIATGVAGLFTYDKATRRASFSLGGFIKKIWLSGVAALKSAGRYIMAAVSGLGGYISGLIAATAAQIGLNVAMNANPIGLVIAGLVAIGAAVYAIIKHWDVVKKWLINLGKFVLKYNPFALLLKGIDLLFPGFLDTLKEWWNEITGFFKKIGGWFSKIWNEYLAPLFGFEKKQEITVEDNTKKRGFDLYATAMDADDKPDPLEGLMPDMPNMDGQMAQYSPAGTNTPTNEKAVSTITGGGKQIKNITIKIDNLLGENTNIFREGEGPEDARDMVEEMQAALQEVLNDVNAT